MPTDPIVDEIRAVRDELAARHDYDIHRIMADARKRQVQYQSRLVSFEEKQIDAAAGSKRSEIGR